MVIGRFVLLIILCASFAAADPDGYNNSNHETLSEQSISLVIIASAFILLCVCTAVLIKKKSERFKVALFSLIVIATIATTLYLSISTVLLNTRSESNGPVHWHTDFELWKCGERINLMKPTGLSNRIGTPVFHEHGDQRIHVEGVVTELEDVNLKNFFYVVGGKLSDDRFELPTDNGIITAHTGELCQFGDGKLQVFLYHVTNPDQSKNKGFTYTQTKLEDFTQYVPAPYAHVPPGDCIIVEFDIEKEKTDKLCETYRIARDKGYITEVTDGS